MSTADKGAALLIIVVIIAVFALGIGATILALFGAGAIAKGLGA